MKNSNRSSYQGFSDFRLKDIEGQPVLENTDYRLEMYDHDENVLDMHNAKLNFYMNRLAHVLFFFLNFD
jgi:hypothetical protein